MTAWILLPALIACLATAGPAQAGSDDFDFGRKLAEKRYYKLAKKVFDAMLVDPKGTTESKDLARYGLATLGYEEAQGAARDKAVPFPTVIKMAETAAGQVAEFAQKNPRHERAGEAKLMVGSIYIWVVQWCQGLVADPAQLEARKTNAADALTAARTAVDKAEKQFEALKGEPELVGALATYHWTMCQYWRALVFEPCSTAQNEALAKAVTALVADPSGTQIQVIKYAPDSPDL
jgi:hypothetical protein